MAGSQLRLRMQTKSGLTLLEGLQLTSTVCRLKEIIADCTSIPKHRIRIRLGYPPKVIDISNELDQLSSLPVRSGDTIIVEEDETVGDVGLVNGPSSLGVGVSATKHEPSSSSVEESVRKHGLSDTDEEPGTKHDDRLDIMLHHQLEEGATGILTRKVVPADNSCLFTSVYLVMNDGLVDLDTALQLREVIAGIVSSDPSTFCEALLGKPNKSYCRWILDKNSWGGGIELAILSQYFNTEIAVVDTLSGRVDRFGEDKQYKERVFVIYDGIHYDPLVYESIEHSGQVRTKFSVHNAVIMAQALELASEAKSIRQFTDVVGFSLRCLACQQPLRGEREATDHARLTGHINFGEY